MITEPPTDGQRTPLQEFETLYIGQVRSLPSFVGPLSAMSWQNQDLAASRLGSIKNWQNQGLAESRLGQIKTIRDCEGSLTTRMARIVLVTVFGDGSNGNKHEVER